MGKIETPPQPTPAAASQIAAKLLNRHSPHEIAEAIEILIDVLDLLGGDPDDEEDSEDCCDARDDGCGGVWKDGRLRWGSEWDEQEF